MMEIKRIFYLIMLSCSLLILGACSDNVESSSIDKNVVTNEYLDFMIDVVSRYEDLAITVSENIDNPEKIKEEAESYIDLNFTNRVYPTTQAEEEIDDYLLDFLNDSETSAKYHIEYGDSEDMFYLELASEYDSSATDNLEKAMAIMKKYEE